MDKSHLIRLTKIIYKLTLLFPKKEPLRYKMRQAADEILEESIASLKKNPNPTIEKTRKEFLLKKFEILDSFFEVARDQNWVALKEISEIQEEYRKIKDEAEKALLLSQEIAKNEEAKKNEKSDSQKADFQEAEEPNLPSSNFQFPISERQEKIIQFLKENEKAQVWQVQKIFPNITKRTLRRDFKGLLKKGIIERLGERNNTFYRLKEA